MGKPKNIYPFPFKSSNPDIHTIDMNATRLWQRNTNIFRLCHTGLRVSLFELDSGIFWIAARLQEHEQWQESLFNYTN